MKTSEVNGIGHCAVRVSSLPKCLFIFIFLPIFLPIFLFIIESNLYMIHTSLLLIVCFAYFSILWVQAFHSLFGNVLFVCLFCFYFILFFGRFISSGFFFSIYFYQLEEVNQYFLLQLENNHPFMSPFQSFTNFITFNFIYFAC